VDCPLLVYTPDEKKASSDTNPADSEPTAHTQDAPCQALGGGVMMNDDVLLEHRAA